MLATDVENDKNRFERAKRLIGQRIDQMVDEDMAMLITFNDRAEVLQAFTSDRRRLRDALSRANVSRRPTDILGALKAADGLANPRRTSEYGNQMDVQVADAQPADLYYYSDGGFPAVNDFDLGNLEPNYVKIGTKDVRNIAITAFSAERNVEQPSQIQAYATIVNFSSEDVSTSATLFVEDAFEDAESIQLEPGEEVGVSFSIEREDAVALRVEVEEKDDFMMDNIAFAGLTPMRTVNVLILTSANVPLEKGLTTENSQKICNTEFRPTGYLSTDEYKKRAATGVDDLIIYDRCAPGKDAADEYILYRKAAAPRMEMEIRGGDGQHY